LLLLADFQPELDQNDARLDDVAFKPGTVLNECPVLVLRAEVHDILDPCAVVPAPIEDDDFPRGREVLDVALHVQLRLFQVRRCRQRHEAKDARAHPLEDRLEGSTFAGGIAALEDNDHAQALVNHPVLQPT
jgi:hypothetical protein